MINITSLNMLTVGQVRHLYNKFLYYFSLGHNLDTIVNETVDNVRNLFYSNGHANMKFKIISDERFKENISNVHIVDRVCYIRLYFTTLQEIKENELLFSSIPSPTLPYNANVETSEGSKLVTVNNDGLKMYSSKLPANTTVRGNLMYIVDK